MIVIKLALVLTVIVIANSENVPATSSACDIISPPDTCSLKGTRVCGFNGIEYKIFRNICKLNLTEYCKISTTEVFRRVEMKLCRKFANKEEKVDKSLLESNHNRGGNKNCNHYRCKNVRGEPHICGADGIKHRKFKSTCQMKHFNCAHKAGYVKARMTDCVVKSKTGKSWAATHHHNKHHSLHHEDKKHE